MVVIISYLLADKFCFNIIVWRQWHAIGWPLHSTLYYWPAVGFIRMDVYIPSWHFRLFSITWSVYDEVVLTRMKTWRRLNNKNVKLNYKTKFIYWPYVATTQRKYRFFSKVNAVTQMDLAALGIYVMTSIYIFPYRDAKRLISH